MKLNGMANFKDELLYNKQSWAYQQSLKKKKKKRLIWKELCCFPEKYKEGVRENTHDKQYKVTVYGCRVVREAFFCPFFSF